MSEQFAIQPEEFDSTNDRLDSILDRLNSLGQSATEMKAAPLRPLQSVPDLGDDISPDEDVVETPDLVPPAIPQLGLVPPAIPSNEEVFEVEHPAVEDPAVADTEASSDALGSLDTVDLGADFESVTPIEGDREFDAEVELAPHDLEAPEAGGILVANEPPEIDPAGQVTDEDIALAETAVEPVTDEPYFDTTITSPHSIFDQVAPATVGEVAPATADHVAPEPQVFEFDAPAETVPSPPQRPEAPTSIFSSSLGKDGNDKAGEPPAAETDGWISHTAPEQEFGAEERVTPDAEIAAPVTTSFFDQDEVATPEPAVTPAEQVVAPFEPQVVASEVEQTLVEIDELDAVDPFAEDAPETSFVIAGIDSPLTDHVPSSFDALETNVTASEPAGLYDSDEELPLPDFTGVYDELPQASEAVRSPKLARASIRDQELDKLRPEEDDLETLAVEADSKTGAGWTPLLQLIFVIGFGVAVLVFFWLQDPTAVADMRTELDALLGRN